MAWMFDTNVLLDLVTRDPNWFTWSERQLRTAQSTGPIAVNPLIYAELAAAFETSADLDDWLRPPFFIKLPLPYEAAFAASRAFLAYRRAAGRKTSPLPDFYIGAHAEHAGFTLVTRDAGRYRTYFPKIKLVTPGT